MNYKSILKNFIERVTIYKNTNIISLILILTFSSGLVLGLLIKPNKLTPIIIDKNVKIGLPEGANLANLSGSGQENGNFVASINGKAYYPKNCKAANVIKEENRIWFNNAEEAQMQGYSLAKNCQ